MSFLPGWDLTRGTVPGGVGRYPWSGHDAAFRFFDEEGIANEATDQ